MAPRRVAQQASEQRAGGHKINLSRQMSKSVFISHSHTDAIDIAHWLHQSLTAEGFDVWLDTRRLQGGASWTEELELAIDGCDVVLAVLTPGSYISEICRAEQLRSLRNGKRVIPLLGRPQTRIP